MDKNQALAALNTLGAAARQAQMTWDEHQASAQSFTRLQALIHEVFAPKPDADPPVAAA